MFRAAVAELRGTLVVAAPVDEAFWLFSPEGEAGWVAGWNPEWLCPASGEWVAGQVFRTRSDDGQVVWLVAALDLEGHGVVYHRVAPSRHVAKVRVECAAAGVDRTDVVVSYQFIGLSDRGNQAIEAMSPVSHAERMLAWQSSIELYLKAEGAGRRRTRG